VIPIKTPASHTQMLTRRKILAIAPATLAIMATGTPPMANPQNVIDALDQPHPAATLGTSWELVSDRVMGGVSSGTLRRETVDGRTALRLTGTVSLDNNGGFVQVALDLDRDRGTVDARPWTGLELDVYGNGERYNLHLRTADVVRPWQSYRSEFTAEPQWRTIRLPFASFEAHRIDRPLDAGRLRRIGFVAIGRAFSADIAIAGVRFYA